MQKQLVLALFALPSVACVVSTHGGPGAAPDVPLPAVAEAPKAAPPKGPSNIGARHILISWRGTQGGGFLVDRNKEEAKALADELRARIRQGEKLSDLARQFSDDAGSKPGGGDLGVFRRADMVKPFSEAAFGLEVGQISDVVESPFGYHIIERTQ
jgi:peptidyl-prolyl cis-trans isomerase NIMA-interacting 1